MGGGAEKNLANFTPENWVHFFVVQKGGPEKKIVLNFFASGPTNKYMWMVPYYNYCTKDHTTKKRASTPHILCLLWTPSCSNQWLTKS